MEEQNRGMSRAQPLILAMTLLAAAGCGSDKSAAPTGTAAGGGSPTSAGGKSTGDTGVSSIAAVTDACTVLAPSDFKAVGFTVESAGEDVSQNFNLSTTTSVACQWTNFDDNQGGSWELVIGHGDAKAAYDGDLLLSKIDTVTKLSIGDEAFLADKVTSSDPNDHDFEAAVRLGDTYFTMSTTADNGSGAITTLAKLVIDRLKKS
jgi:hypothetical protein